MTVFEGREKADCVSTGQCSSPLHPDVSFTCSVGNAAPPIAQIKEIRERKDEKCMVYGYVAKGERLQEAPC